MNLFYNENGVGNVLLAQLTTSNPEKIEAKTYNDVTLLHDAEEGKVVGFNLFNATTYVQVEGNGEIQVTEEMIDALQKALKTNEVDLVLDVDLSPKFVVGHVVSKDKHPNADKLSVCSVDVGDTTLQIVCGAANVAAGQKVVVAKVGAVMPSGLIIRDAELRGVASSGMICSASELGLPNAEENVGILVLDGDAVVGKAFQS